MKKITPLVKGIITGILMVAATLILLQLKVPQESGLQNMVYGIYAGGIIWTLLTFSKTPAFTGKFSELFGQGFRCFVIVTIIMVAFVGIYSFAHPEIAEQQAVLDRKYLVENEKSLTPNEIDARVTKAKDNFVISSMYSAVFGTLIIGTIFTLAGATLVLLSRRK
jgi:uncharacterized membrane protein